MYGRGVFPSFFPFFTRLLLYDVVFRSSARREKRALLRDTRSRAIWISVLRNFPRIRLVRLPDGALEREMIQHFQVRRVAVID